MKSSQSFEHLLITLAKEAQRVVLALLPEYAVQIARVHRTHFDRLLAPAEQLTAGSHVHYKQNIRRLDVCTFLLRVLYSQTVDKVGVML